MLCLTDQERQNVDSGKGFPNDPQLKSPTLSCEEFEAEHLPDVLSHGYCGQQYDDGRSHRFPRELLPGQAAIQKPHTEVAEEDSTSRQLLKRTVDPRI